MNKTERFNKVIELININILILKISKYVTGNNSQVFQLIHESGEKHALKLFPEKRSEDHRLKESFIPKFS